MTPTPGVTTTDGDEQPSYRQGQAERDSADHGYTVAALADDYLTAHEDVTFTEPQDVYDWLIDRARNLGARL